LKVGFLFVCFMIFFFLNGFLCSVNLWNVTLKQCIKINGKNKLY
jgi:hypothetical protein